MHRAEACHSDLHRHKLTNYEKREYGAGKNGTELSQKQVVLGIAFMELFSLTYIRLCYDKVNG